MEGLDLSVLDKYKSKAPPRETEELDLSVLDKYLTTKEPLSQEKEPGLDLSVLDKYRESPSNWAVAGQGLVSGGGNTIKAATGIAGSLFNRASEALGGAPDTADPLIAWGQEQSKRADATILTPQERQGMTIPQEILSGVAQAPQMFLAGGAGAIPMAAGLGTMNTGTELLDKGADLQHAQAGGIVSGVTGAMAMGVPLGSTMAKSVGLQVGANIVGGVVERGIIRDIMHESPKIAKQYDPWDKRALAVSAGSGVVFGAGMHAYRNVSSANAQANLNKKLVDVINDQAIAALETQTGDLLDTRVKSGKTMDQLWDGKVGNKVIDGLDAVLTHSKSTASEKALAEAFIRLHEANGIGDVEVVEIAPPTDANGKVIKKQGMHYNPTTDTIEYYGNIKSPQYADIWSRTLLHETVHAGTSRSINDWDNIKSKAGTPDVLQAELDKLSPKQREQYNRVDALNDLFQQVKQRYSDKTGFDPVLLRTQSKKVLKNVSKHTLTEIAAAHSRKSELYGLTDVHEFVTEVMTNPHFQKLLSNMELKPFEEQTSLSPKGRGRLRNAWEATKKAIKEVVLGPHPSSMLDVAFDHAVTLMEHQGALKRAKGPERDTKIADGRTRTQQGNSIARELMLRTSNLLQVSGTDKGMFETRLRAENLSPEWQAYVDRNLDKLWDNPRRLHETVSNKEYQQRSDADKLLSHDPRTVHEMMEQTVPESLELVQADDISLAGTDTMNSQVTSLMKGNTVAGKVMKWVKNKAEEYKTLQTILFHKAMERQVLTQKLPYKQQLQLWDAMIDINSRAGREKLEAAGQQWADEVSLRNDYHLNDKQVEAYKEMTKGYDFLWDLIGQTRTALGHPPLPRIPGFMPHVHEGAFKVFLTVSRDGGKNWRVSAVKGYKTSFFAMRYVNDIRSGRYDSGQLKFGVEVDGDTRLPYKIQKHGDLTSGLVSSLQEHLKAYQGALDLQPEARKILETIEKNNMTGFSKHLMESQNISGYIGQYGTVTKGLKGLKERLGIGTSENTKILSLYENYARSVTEYYKSVIWSKEVISPLIATRASDAGDMKHYGNRLIKLSNLNKHITDYSYNFTGENINKLSWVDDWAQARSLDLGQDPHLYRRFSRDIRNLLSLIKLRGNLTNYSANIVQPMHMIGLLQYVNSSRMVDGNRTQNVAISISKALKNIVNPDADTIASVNWAREQGILDAQLEPEMRGLNPSRIQKAAHAVTLGGVNPFIESIGRRSSFIMAFEHMKSVYPNDIPAARRAAANLMEMGMVNYDRSSRPLMYQNYGVVGEGVSPFAVFRNAYIGNTYLMLKLAAKNPTMLSQWTPLLLMQSTYLMLAGATGMILASEYDIIANMLNDAFPAFHVPTLEGLLAKNHVPDAITFGVLSEATKSLPGTSNGVQVGTSGAAVGADDVFSVAMVPFIEAMAKVIGMGGRQLLSMMTEDVLPVQSKDMWAAGQQLVPPVFKRRLESQINNREDIGFKSNDTQGATSRDQADRNALDYWGKKSIKETKEGIINREQARTQKQKKSEIAALTNLAADFAEDIPIPRTREQLFHRAAELGLTTEEFSNGIIEEITNRRTTVRQRDALSTTTDAARRLRERAAME